MKKYIVSSVYTATKNHIIDWIEAENLEEAMEKADLLPDRMSYSGYEVDEFPSNNQQLGGYKGSVRSRIHSDNYNPD